MGAPPSLLGWDTVGVHPLLLLDGPLTPCLLAFHPYSVLTCTLERCKPLGFSRPAFTSPAGENPDGVGYRGHGVVLAVPATPHRLYPSTLSPDSKILSDLPFFKLQTLPPAGVPVCLSQCPSFPASTQPQGGNARISSPHPFPISGWQGGGVLPDRLSLAAPVDSPSPSSTYCLRSFTTGGLGSLSSLSKNVS